MKGWLIICRACLDARPRELKTIGLVQTPPYDCDECGTALAVNEGRRFTEGYPIYPSQLVAGHKKVFDPARLRFFAGDKEVGPPADGRMYQEPAPASLRTIANNREINVVTRGKLLAEEARRLGGECVFEEDVLSRYYGRLVGFRKNP